MNKSRKCTGGKVMIVAAAVSLAADILSKLSVMRLMMPGESIVVIPNILKLTFVQNDGIAFGLLKGNGPVLTAFIAMIIAALFIYLLRTARARNAPSRWALVLIICGAFGNYLDRLRYGYIVDMIDLGFWPVFNLADAYITTGAGLLIVNLFGSAKST